LGEEVDRLMARLDVGKAWCVGVLSDSLAIYTNIAFRPLVIQSDTGGIDIADIIAPCDSQDPSLTLHMNGLIGFHITCCGAQS